MSMHILTASKFVHHICCYRFPSGEDVAFYFGWMNFYSTYMIVPAVLGLVMYMFRPSGITVDTDPYLPFFSVFMAIWAVLFVVVSVGKGVVFPGGEIGLMRDPLEKKRV